MSTRDNAPPPPDWRGEPRPNPCDVRDALTQLDGTEPAALSLMTGLSIAEIEELGGLGEN